MFVQRRLLEELNRPENVAWEGRSVTPTARSVKIGIWHISSVKNELRVQKIGKFFGCFFFAAAMLFLV